MSDKIQTEKTMSREEALNVVRRLIQESVEVANKAGITLSSVPAPHDSEPASKDDKVGYDDSKAPNWCGVPVVVDDNTDGLFEMPELDDDPEQKPAFLVTRTTVELVGTDFERYRPSLERMAEDWQEEKEQAMREQASRKREAEKSGKGSEPEG